MIITILNSRIQTIGRLLRKGGASQPVIYLFYVPDTSDVKSLTNLIHKGFPQSKMRFMRYYPDHQKIQDTAVDIKELLKTQSFRKRTPQTCKKCGRTFKSKVGLNNHHCFTHDPDMTFDEFLLGFMSKE